MAERKWAKIVNEDTKQANVGLGTNASFYKKLGFSEMMVEYCDWNGSWYLEGYVPEKPEPTKEEKIALLQKKLVVIDDKSQRSMRAILAGTATEEDRAFLSNLESQAADLRQQIHDLEEAQ